MAVAGLAVLSTLAAALAPWLQGQALFQVLHRIFPFARGLYEDKVANFWCSISVLFKLQRLLSPSRVPALCALCTLLALLPGALGALRSGPGTFAAALFTSSLSFFLFAFQVHEKGVLFPALAVLLLPRSRREWVMALHFQLVSLFSMSLVQSISIALKKSKVSPHGEGQPSCCLYLLQRLPHWAALTA